MFFPLAFVAAGVLTPLLATTALTVGLLATQPLPGSKPPQRTRRPFVAPNAHRRYRF